MTNQFLSSLRPFEHTESDNITLQRLGHFYLRRAHEKFGLISSEGKFIITHLSSASALPDLDGKKLYKKIKSQKKLTNFPVAAMLAENYGIAHPQIELLNDVKAIGTCVAIWYFTTGRNFDDLKKFCYVIRTLPTADMLWLLKLMPEKIISVHQLLNHLEQQIADIPITQVRRFKEFFNPLKSLVDHRGANQTKEQFGRKSPYIGDIDPKTISLKIPGSDEPLSILLNPPETVNPNINYEEQIFDQISSHFTTEFNDQNQRQNKRSQTEREIKGQDLANAFARKATKSIFDWDNLSENEIATLFSYEFANTIKGNKASLLTCLSILTGRSPRRLVALPIQDHNNLKAGDQWVLMNKFVCLVHVLDLPENKTKNSKKIYQETEKNIWLPIPEVLSIPLKELLLKNSLKNIKYSEHFTKLNRRFKNHLSEDRIADVVTRFLSFRNYKTPLIAMFSGEAPQQCPSTFYAGIDRVDLSAAYSSFASYLENLTKIDGLRLSLKSLSNSILGSNVIPRRQIAQERLERIRQGLSGVRKWEAFHNIYTFFIHQLLSLATGHRAVGSPFENIDDFDLEHGFVWICDKENRQEQSSRYIPLAPTALKQIQLYKEHLKSSQYLHSILKSDLADEIGKSLSGQADFLFFFNGKKLTPVTPSSLRAIEKELRLPKLKDNWTRHYLYTHMVRSTVPSSCISNFFGHAPFGQEYGSPLSTSTLADFLRIADETEKCFADLSIFPLNGWEGA